MSWSVKQRRCYSRVLCALEFGYYNNVPVRFMTLTTASCDDFSSMKRDFNVFVKRIREKFGSFEYLCVWTTEGFGVLHIIYFGSYIPKEWISKNWLDVHGAFIIDIQYVDGLELRFARYIISQYLSGGQGSAFIRFSMSKHFVYNGFVDDYRYWKRVCSPDWFRFRWFLCCINSSVRGAGRISEEVSSSPKVKYPVIKSVSNLASKFGFVGNIGYVRDVEDYFASAVDVYGNRISRIDV